MKKKKISFTSVWFYMIMSYKGDIINDIIEDHSFFVYVWPKVCIKVPIVSHIKSFMTRMPALAT